MALYNEYLYGEATYEYPLILGSGTYTATINYIAGMTVLISANCVYTKPANTTAYLEASFDSGITWAEFDCNTGTVQGFFDVETDGNQDLLLKIVLETSDPNLTPSIDSLSLTISQMATLYTIAKKVLKDKGLAGDQYWIDTELHEYKIPYAWVDSKTHRECLRLVAEACAGQIYMSPEDIVRVEGPSYLEEQKLTSSQTITTDDYVSKSNPANYSGIANYIEIITQPLIPATVAEEVYRSGEPEEIAIAQTKTLTVFYTKKPVIEAVASLEGAPAGLIISSETYYAWGAVITVSGATVDGTFTLVVSGKPLEIKGTQKVIVQDETSIRENGKLIYKFPENPFVQTVEMAEKLGEKILALSKDSRRDFEANWRGNFALELGDRFTAPDSKTTVSDFWITSQTIEFDGTLSATIKGKKVL